MRTCSIEGCEKRHQARGWCPMHYFRWKATGDPLKTPSGVPHGLPAIDRFMLKVRVQPDGCWLWTGATDGGRYGRFVPHGGRPMFTAHRWIYEQTVGPIPEGLELDHFKCERTLCVNPEHVRPTTRRENLLRSRGLPSVNLAKTHCKHGHEFTPENTRRMPDGERRCKICEGDRQRAYRKRRRENQRK